MPTFKTTQMTNRGNFVANAPYEHGVVKTFYGVYTTLGTETTADILNVASLPNGAMVLPTSEVHFEAMGGSLTFAVGDGDDDNRYKTATSCASAGSMALDTIGGMGYVVGTASDDEVVSLLIGGGTVAASKEIHVYIQYVV
jgi:hypothetical protein